MSVPDALERVARCVLAFSGQRGPVISPMAFWSDGASLWMATPAQSVKAAALRHRPQCAVHVPAIDGTGEDVVLRGHARVYGLHDPLGLALHGPIISAAMTALASRNAGTILGYVQDARQVPARFRPHNRVAVRIAIDDAETLPAMEPGPGVAPALPTVVAPEIRRALSGRRTVSVATQNPAGDVAVGPAVWSAGYTLRFPAGRTPFVPCAAAVHVGEDVQGRPTDVAGLTLTGRLDEDRLEVRRATWWEGFRLHTADVPPPARSTLVLPD